MYSKPYGSWKEYFEGGFVILPDDLARAIMNLTYYNPHYEQMRLNEHTTILGIWDDNDYGVNDGKWDNPVKNVQKQRFLEYLDETDSNRYRRAVGNDEQGLEEHYQVQHDELSLRIILPDLRFYLRKGDIMGEKQWRWLEAIFENTEDDLYIIVSGVQLYGYNRLEAFEHWPQQSVKRLLHLQAKFNRKPMFVVSGDVHFA